MINDNNDFTTISKKDDDNLSDLMVAIKNKARSFIRTLTIDKRVDVNAQSKSGFTALMITLDENDWETFEFLLTLNDINTDVQDCFGNTVLIYAILIRNYHFAKALLERGADASVRNNNGDDAMRFASFVDPSAEMVRLLNIYKKNW